MLKRLAKVISMIMVISMIFSLFVGCGQSQQKADDKQPNTTNQKSDTQVKDTKTLEEMDPFSEEYDIKVEEDALAKCTTPDYFKNTPTYEYTVEFNVAPLNDSSFGQRYFEKKFNVKLNYIRLEGENRQEQLRLMLATGTIPDVAKVTLPEIAEYTKQGILAELPEEMVKDNMPGYYGILQKNDANLLKYTRVDGKNMGLALFHPYGGIPRPAAIRADWLKNVGINKVPSTIDELTEAFLRFRNDDPDKNGKKDTYALSSPSDAVGEMWFQSIFGAFGGNPFIWTERNGKLVFGFTTNEAKEALKLLNNWYESGIIDPEFITDKGRSSEAEDLATKFAKGKLGYIDNLNYEDHQWDNDGHINFRWFANSPEWEKWWEDNKNDVNKLYSTKVFTDFDDSVPQPIYITMPAVKGPKGETGYYRRGYSEMALMFGKQLEKEPEKFEKLLRIFEYQNQDEETYLMLGAGPEGQNWISGPNGQKLLNPDWSKHKHFHPQFKIVGTVWTTLPMYWTNPDYLSIVGGPRAEQRHARTADIVKTFSFYEDKVKVPLPSRAKYSELVDTRIKEYVIRAIAGDIDIDKTFDDAVSRWYKDGGEQLTQEANEWYNSIK